MKYDFLLSRLFWASTLLTPACISLEHLPVQEADAGDAATSQVEDDAAAPSTTPTETELDAATELPDATAMSDARTGPVVTWWLDAGDRGDASWGSQDAAPEPDASVEEECKCTRRSQSSPSIFCPRGTGTASSSTIGPKGGSVELGGTLSTVGVTAEVEIPASALSASTEVTITELKTDPPLGFVDYSPLYQVGPADLSLALPGQITLPFKNINGVVPSDLAMYRADTAAGPFTRLPDSYRNAGFSQASLLRGGVYFVGYVTPPSQAHCNVVEPCSCTRRPEGEPDRSCPRGTGVSASTSLGSAGGTAQLGNTPSTVAPLVSVKVPPNALQATTVIVISELTTPPPKGFVDASPVYRIEPSDLSLQIPGELVVPTQSSQTSGVAERAIYRADAPEGPFVRIADSYQNAGFMQATLIHGGYYFAGYPTPPAQSHCP